MKAITKLQLALLKTKVKAALSGKGTFQMKGFGLRADGRHLSIGSLEVRSDIKDINLSMDSLESISEEGSYKVEVEIKDLLFTYREKEFSIEEITLVGVSEVKEFALNLKGLMDALK